MAGTLRNNDWAGALVRVVGLVHGLCSARTRALQVQGLSPFALEPGAGSRVFARPLCCGAKMADALLAGTPLPGPGQPSAQRLSRWVAQASTLVPPVPDCVTSGPVPNSSKPRFPQL